MYQKLVIAGNLGGDPDLRYTPQGDPVCTFSVACNRKWTGKDGQAAEETVWYRVTVWGKMAEACNQYLAKGRQVLVEGQLTPDKATGGPRVWTDNSGNARASYEMRAGIVQFLGGRDGGAQSGSTGPPAQSSSASSAGPPADNIAEDEIPF